MALVTFLALLYLVFGDSIMIMGLTTLIRWAIRAAMTMGTAMPRLLAATGGLGLMVKGCSEEEGLMFGSETTAEVSLGVFLVRWRSCMIALLCSVRTVGPSEDK